MDGFITKYISVLKWAWQAQFLSRSQVILKNSVFYEEKQIILVSFWNIFTGFRFPKNLKSLPIQVLRHPWLDISLIHVLSHALIRYKFDALLSFLYT